MNGTAQATAFACPPNRRRLLAGRRDGSNLSTCAGRSGRSHARADIQDVDAKIAQFEPTHPGVLPDRLADIGAAGLRDPRGRPYQYLNLRDPANLINARKDRNLHPISSDYDPYSAGRDGITVKPLTRSRARTT